MPQRRGNPVNRDEMTDLGDTVRRSIRGEAVSETLRARERMEVLPEGPDTGAGSTAPPFQNYSSVLTASLQRDAQEGSTPRSTASGEGRSVTPKRRPRDSEPTSPGGMSGIPDEGLEPFGEDEGEARTKRRTLAQPVLATPPFPGSPSAAPAPAHGTTSEGAEHGLPQPVLERPEGSEHGLSRGVSMDSPHAGGRLGAG